MTELHIIDALGPFFLENSQSTVNWSKVSFSVLEHDGRLPKTTATCITERFENFIKTTAKLGFDAISIDDLAHLATFPFYNASLQLLLKDYDTLYNNLFKIAKKHGMRIFVTTDFLFYNDDIERHIKTSGVTPSDFFLDVLKKAIARFPAIDGIILRIGENDGKDVTGTFLSRLELRTPEAANALLKKILPFFERHDKTLIFRTWTVGVYELGDLIWNERTFAAVFESIESDALIISMKFGDTDFMRYLPLNPLFFHGKHKKIVELQTRREWEGMGMHPSFIGWDYSRYFNMLSKEVSVVGIHVWCQTGGWAKRAWNNVTFLNESSFWNELNTEVTISLFKNKTSVHEAIAVFCRKHAIPNVVDFERMLRLSEIAINKGLYIEEIAKKPRYFRRTRIPSLIWIMWDTMLLQPVTVYLLRALVKDRQKALREADEAVRAIQEMKSIAISLGMEKRIIESLDFHYETLIIFAKLRRYIFSKTSPEEITSINQAARRYTNKYPQHYTIPELQPLPKNYLPLSTLLSLFVRTSSAYRKRDILVLLSSPLQRKLLRSYLKKSPSKLKNQSMGIESLFR